MRTQKRTRLLSALMALLMVFSLLPASALAADASTTWEPIDLADITPSDTVAITMSKDDTTWALPAAKNTSTAPAAQVVTVADGKLTIAAAAADYGWTITASEGSYQIKNANGDFLYTQNGNNGVRIGSTQDSWSLDSGYLKDVSFSRFLGVYMTSPDWRAYTSINNNITGQTLQFWKLKEGAEPDPTEEPTEQTLLTKLDAAPADGDVVYLAHPDSGMVLTAAASGKKLAGVEAQKAEDQLVLSETMAALNVAVKENVYTFSNGGKFLTSGETGSSVTFAEDGESDLAKWKLEQQTDGTWILMNVGAAFNGNHNQALEYYSGFTTYGVKADNAAYKFAFYAEIASDPVSGLKTGDTVAIFNDGNGKAMTAAASGTRLAAADAVLGEDGKLSGENIALFTVTVNEDGTLSFAADGKYLTSGATGSSLTLEETANEYSLWVIEDAGDGLFFLKNANAAYKGNAQYLEYFNTFTTYGKSATAAPKAFAMSFRQLAEDVEPSPEPTTEPSTEPTTEPAASGLVTDLAQLKDGDTIAIVNPANKKALSQTMTGNYSAGVDVTIADGKLSGYTASEIFTVTKNEDGSYSFAAADGTKFGMQDQYASTSMGAVNDKWTVSAAATADCFYFQNVARGNYLEWYASKNNWSTYTRISDEALFAQQIYLVTAPETPSGDSTAIATLDELKDGATVLIYNVGHKTAASSSPNGDWYLKAVSTEIVDGKPKSFTADLVWTVGVKDGVYTFSNGENVMTCWLSESNGKQYAEVSVDGKKYPDTGWNVTVADAANRTFYIKNATVTGSYGPAYLEGYTRSDAEVFSGYFTNKIDNDQFRMQFYPVDPADAAEEPGIDYDGVLTAGSQVVIYNAEAQGSFGLDNAGLNTSLGSIPTELRDGKAYPQNGAYVFTVGVEQGYYTFCAGGKYLTTNNEESLFLQTEKTEAAKWYLKPNGSGYTIYNKQANYNGTPVCIEFYSAAFSGWTFKSAEPNIFSMQFYPIDSSITTLDDVTNVPKIHFTATEDPIKQQEYKVTFQVDDLTPLEKLTVTARLNGQPVENLVNDGKNFSFIVPAEFTATADSLNITVQVANADGAIYLSDQFLPVRDIPVFDELTPAPGSKTGEDLMPRISAKVLNALDTDQAAITVNGKVYSVPIVNGRISYTPTEPLPEGRVSVKVEVKRADGITGEKTWSFTVGEGGARLYFGQLHSHTTFSDGSGTLTAALDYIKGLPESANVQFVAFTDHSNYFDTNSAANPEGALYDMSLATQSSQNLWKEYRQTVADFNAKQQDVIALAGFEMTWSGGPGHINTFNSPGIVSRNNATLNQKTNDAGMKAYYALLNQQEGADTLSQFNHPGKTFGNFSDFSYWDAVTDSRMFMVEVGNGEGQIGAGGYYPSYEQYIMALDKGWHVAPTNNQDNHKGRWGNANDARDVILTEDFSEQGIYDAIRAMRMYATEDKNLEVYYTINDQPLGSILSEVPEQLAVNVQVSDPDKSDSVSKVEIVVNSGKTSHSFALSEINTGSMKVTLAPEYSYYFIRVTEGDGDIAVTAPIWVGETLKLGISAFESETAMPVTGEELTLTTTLYNSEAAAASVKSITYTTNGSKVLGVDDKGYSVPANGTLAIPFAFTPDVARVMTVTATVVMEQGGKEYTFTKDLTLDVQNAEELVYIGIDASHYNEYVAGNYKDSMSNFAALASEYAVRTVYLKTSDELIAACGNEKFKAIVLTAPSRRDGSNLRSPYATYSDSEIEAIAAFNAGGGTVIVTGWSDYYEHYAEFPAEDHMAAQQNKLLAALGSSLRIADDGTNDNELNGGQTPRLYFSTYNLDNPLLAGVELDPEHPNDRAYSEVFSHYGGASIYAVDASGAVASALPETVSPAVYGHSSTYSADSDTDGLGGSSVPKYPVAENDSRLLVMATEQLPGKGLIVVSGAAFLSNFEVQAAASSGSTDADTQKNYSNYKVCENLISPMNTAKVSTIADVRAVTEEGFKFTIEGVVTSNASGYDKDTAFFDCIYVQDETAGICCFPVAGSFKVGDKVRITGTTDFYQGEPELQVISIAVIGEGEIAPEEVTAAAVMSREAEGKLITFKGTVESFELENGLVQTIMVKDAKGDVARVFIDGYITTAKDVENLAEGAEITVTGLASYDDTFKAPEGPFPRIRVRDRTDVVCTAVEEQHKCAVFKDIVGHWAQQDICYVVENDIMNGMDMAKGVFGPNETTTRAMVVAVLYRMAGSPAVEGKTAFTDLTQKWYQDAVLWAVQNNITKGRSATTFAPDAAVTRAELVTFLMRYAQFKGANVSGRDDLKQFNDRGDVPAWALDAMQWAVKEGIVSGMTPTTLVPGGASTRAQLATVLSRMMQKGA